MKTAKFTVALGLCALLPSSCSKESTVEVVNSQHSRSASLV